MKKWIYTKIKNSKNDSYMGEYKFFPNYSL
jgi:hypothetical protein